MYNLHDLAQHILNAVADHVNLYVLSMSRQGQESLEKVLFILALP